MRFFDCCCVPVVCFGLTKYTVESAHEDVTLLGDVGGKQVGGVRRIHHLEHSSTQGNTHTHGGLNLWSQEFTTTRTQCSVWKNNVTKHNLLMCHEKILLTLYHVKRNHSSYLCTYDFFFFFHLAVSPSDID